MIPLRFCYASTFISFYVLVFLLPNLSTTTAFAAKYIRAHKCIPNTAASTIKCKRWKKEVKSYCGSTRKGQVFWASDRSPIAAAANYALDESEFQVIRYFSNEIVRISGNNGENGHEEVQANNM